MYHGGIKHAANERATWRAEKRRASQLLPEPVLKCRIEMVRCRRGRQGKITHTQSREAKLSSPRIYIYPTPFRVHELALNILHADMGTEYIIAYFP